MYFIFKINISNEKIGFLVALASVIICHIKISKKYLLYSALLSICVFLPAIFRYFIYGDFLFDQDISFLIFSFSLPIYMALFSYKIERNDSIFLNIVKLQAIVFIIQLLGKWFGLPVETIFIHNSIQDSYIYPQVFGNFYRVAGFLNESSQIGILFCMAYWYFSGRKSRNILIILIILTFSITAYVMLILILLPELKKPKVFIPILLIFILTLIIFNDFFYKLYMMISYRIELISNTQIDISKSDPRIKALLLDFERIFQRPFVGWGASLADSDRWDIFSVYWLPFGIIAGSGWLFFICSILLSGGALFIYIPVMLTNITMLSYVNMFSFILCENKYRNRKLQ
jgi:hypothetical protein